MLDAAASFVMSGCIEPPFHEGDSMQNYYNANSFISLM